LRHHPFSVSENGRSSETCHPGPERPADASCVDALVDPRPCGAVRAKPTCTLAHSNSPSSDEGAFMENSTNLGRVRR
jgi:hypothetical protein